MAIQASSLIRVLVIDDHHNGAESLGMLLEQLGCDVRIAYGGSEAIASAPSFRPQLVITDINMSGLNGYQTVKRLKEQSWANSAVFVAHSAVPPGIGHSKSSPTPFLRYITKPGMPSDFDAVLSEVRAAGFSTGDG
jgi:CheY-like chemotaxis protein